MSYVLLLLYFGILSLLIYRSKFFESENLSSTLILGVFLTKFLAGLFLWAVYAFLYEGRATGDIFKYFDDGNIIFSALRENPIDYFRMITGIGSDSPYLMKYYDTCNFWIKEFNYGLINDNRLVIRFNAIVRLVSMGNIHIHTLFMSFLSFVGLMSIYKVVEQSLDIKKYILVLFIFFFPSVFFWTSGLLKEGLLMFAFGILFYQMNKLLTTRITIQGIVLVLIAIFILLLSKFYVLVAALPGFLFLILHQHMRTKSLLITLALSHGIFLLFAWFTEPIFGIGFPNLLATKQNDFVLYAQGLEKVGSLIEMSMLEPTFKSIFLNLPQALFNSFFRPSLFESNGIFMLMAAFENFVIIILILITFLFFNKRNLQNPILWFSLSFVLILYGIIGLTTPVLGALVRYKAPALPFLGVIFIMLIDNNKIEKIINRYKLWQKQR